VTNADYAKALTRALHRPALLPKPTFAPKLAFGEGAFLVTAARPSGTRISMPPWKILRGPGRR